MRTVQVILLSCCLFSCVLSKPAAVFLGYQDSLGQYSFGYSAPGSARSEVRTSNGATRGAYSYVDEKGVIQTAQYVADGENGFRVIATNLPQAPLPVQETEEVAAARAAHLKAVELAKKAEEAKNEEDNGKIGARNVFLQDLQKQSKEQRVEENLEGQIKEKNLEDGQKSGESEKQGQEEMVKIEGPQSAESGRQEFVQVSSEKTSQEIIGASLPIIPSHVIVAQPLTRPAVPIFRVSQGVHEIEPSEESFNLQGSSTPAGTALKDDKKASEGVLSKQSEEEKPKETTEKPVENLQHLVAPVNLVPVSSSYSSFVKYVPPSALHYVTYDFL